MFGALGAFAQKGLECTIGGLNRIEIWGVRRQITQGCAGGFDGLLYPLDLVRGDIIHDDDIAAFKGGRQTLLDIGQKVSPFIAPLIIIGAVIPSQRSAATNVNVFQAANGTRPITRSPLDPRP